MQMPQNIPIFYFSEDLCSEDIFVHQCTNFNISPRVINLLTRFSAVCKESYNGPRPGGDRPTMSKGDLRVKRSLRVQALQFVRYTPHFQCHFARICAFDTKMAFNHHFPVQAKRCPIMSP
jgi:hypothetical protein